MSYGLSYDVTEPPTLSTARAPQPIDLSSVTPAASELGGAAPPADSWDKAGAVFATTLAAQRYDGSTNGQFQATSDSIDEANRQIGLASGSKPENPLAGGYTIAARQRYIDANGHAPDLTDPHTQVDFNQYRVAAWQDEIAALRADNPNIPSFTMSDIDQAAKDRTAKALKDADEAWQHSPGGPGSWAAWAAGAGAAMLRDPIMATSLVAGGGGLKAASVFGRIVEASVKEAVQNAAVQALAEPWVQGWRAERGQEHGLVPSLQDVGLAFLFGAGAGGARAVVHGAPKPLASPELVGRAVSGDLEAAKELAAALPPEVAPELHAAVASEEFDRQSMEAAGPAPEQDTTTARQAIRHVEDPINDPLPGMFSEDVRSAATPEIDAEGVPGQQAAVLGTHAPVEAVPEAVNAPETVGERTQQVEKLKREMGRPETAQGATASLDMPKLPPEIMDALNAADHWIGGLDSILGRYGEASTAPMRVGTEATARLAEQIAHGPTQIAHVLSAPKIAADLGADIPGVALQGLHAVNGGEGGTSGLVAFHGSPHDFDRFSMAHIGTGEGAQAYGHGLYFAESKGIAKSYQSKLSQKTSNPEYIALYKRLNDLSRKISNAQERELNTKLSSAERQAAGREYRNLLGQSLSLQSEIDRVGHLYQVHIETTPERMLDWDKPLDQQPPHVQEAIKKIGPNVWHWLDDLAERRGNNAVSDTMEAYTGADLVKMLYHHDVHEALPEELPGSSWFTGDTTEKKHTAAFLHSLGIDGIQYLDNGSRKVGEGTRNFVVFDDSKIKVTHKNGVALDKPMALEQFLKGEVTGRLGDHLQAHADYVQAHQAVQTAADDGAIARSSGTPPRAKKAKPARELSVLQFLAHGGGLANDPEVRAVLDGNPFVPGAGRLVRKSGGMSLDDALQALKDGGYLFDPADHYGGEATLDTNHVLDLIDREARGEKIYPAGHDPLEREHEAAVREEQYVRDEIVKAHGENAKWLNQGDVRRAAELILEGHEVDPLTAYERATMEAAREDAEARAIIEEESRGTPYEEFAAAGPHEPAVSFDLAEATGHSPALEGEGGGNRLGEPDQTGEPVRRAGEGAGGDAGQGALSPEAGRAEPGAADAQGQAAGGKGLATEPGAEGLPQTLMPGVAPITDRQRLEAQAGKPLEGGNAPPPAGGLFDQSARAQGDLLDMVPIAERTDGEDTRMVPKDQVLNERPREELLAHLVNDCSV